MVSATALEIRTDFKEMVLSMVISCLLFFLLLANQALKINISINLSG
jgi:hypothetical protein